ncbi:hypothetical protein SBA3_880039 [Candidatus Sulfopaludibacter sp. SbA3]|nr:hypothetical protein SBA3_880039 [Candidatus Sulfopaludibacter sp. SbA3]
MRVKEQIQRILAIPAKKTDTRLVSHLTAQEMQSILDAHTAETRCSTLSSKHVSPRVLRHTCALTILQATKDLRKVSLWLGHSSMQTAGIYTRADPSVKLEALESVIAPKLRTAGPFHRTRSPHKDGLRIICYKRFDKVIGRCGEKDKNRLR